MTRLSERRLALAIVITLASASAVNAQDARHPPKWFLTGSILASQDQPVRFEQYHTWQETTWDVALGVGLGAFITERWSWRAEFEVPRRGHAEVAVGAPQLPPNRILYWDRHEVRRRHVTAAGLVGFHPRRFGRIRPSILVGGTMAHLVGEETIQQLFSAGSAWQTIDRGSFSSTHAGVVAGMDVETGLTGAVALVAHVRGSIIAGGAEGTRTVGTVTLPVGIGGDAGIVRLGVGVRWMF
jgi:hypothetical protein